MSIGIYVFLRIFFLMLLLVRLGVPYRTHSAPPSPFRVRWGLWSPPAGYTGNAGGGVVNTSRRKNSKKAFSGVRVANTHPTFTKRHPSDCASLQKFRKIQKGPSRSLDCAIIS
nr:MAG TPA: hypothetical protein [Caudoviricetes sp.]